MIGLGLSTTSVDSLELLLTPEYSSKFGGNYWKVVDDGINGTLNNRTIRAKAAFELALTEVLSGDAALLKTWWKAGNLLTLLPNNTVTTSAYTVVITGYNLYNNTPPYWDRYNGAVKLEESIE